MSAIFGWNIVGIFHGHYHASAAYRYHGTDVYNVGSPKHSYHSFAVVNDTDSHMTVASFNYDADAFWWWHKKPIHGDEGLGTEVIGTRSGLGLSVGPELDL